MSHKTRQLSIDVCVKEVRVVRRNVVPKRFPEVMRVLDILQYDLRRQRTTTGDGSWTSSCDSNQAVRASEIDFPQLASW